MSSPYLITFTPINRFFFGSSHSFAEDFYVESMKYPQPTTILGCLRDTILLQERITKNSGGRYIVDIGHPNAKDLTGTSRVEGLNDSDDNFGKIERLSPIFIVKTQKNGSIADILFPVPADIERNGDFFRYIEYKKIDNAISNYSGMKKPFAILSDKNPKIPSPASLGGREFWIKYIDNRQIPYNSVYSEDEIFKTHISVGIGCENKDTGMGKRYFKKTVQKGMFYTKIDYSLHKDYVFGVIVWLGDNVLEEDIVLLGGEQSAFQMKISCARDGICSSHPVVTAIINNKCDLFQNLNSCTNNDKLVALSPLVFDESVNSRLKDIMEHRIIQGIQSIRTLRRAANGIQKSDATCMIPSGSVLYPERSAKFSGWKIPYKIGYNHVIKTKRG